MVSAGLDTVPGNITQAVGYLASPDGQAIQKRAYEEIMKVYPNGDAWDKCLLEEKVTYITAFVKETLRYWTVIPICLPRVSIKDIEYEGAVIPAGTTFYMVSLLHNIIFPFHETMKRDNILTCAPPPSRTHMPPTTTQPTSNPPPLSTQTATSPIHPPRSPAPRTTATERDPECARALISRTASSTRPSSD